ncbi:hypothetical protein EVAR_12637_1 [Eumeta japonica]|uniref:BED-type domain-containing protein n=1 Tax=Eumeta variegata TaxID=151549 RepID=A0A4C1Z9E1_EUMVA|nr:hypothetical protein EVAR_12637_1 [Eumeta japonica]
MIKSEQEEKATAIAKVCIIGKETKYHLGVQNKYYSNTNHSGPSTAMETKIIVQGFQESESFHGLQYLKFIGDGKKSQVWLHFEEEENSAKCILCGVKISRAAKKAGTTALQNHLKFKHPDEYAKIYGSSSRHAPANHLQLLYLRIHATQSASGASVSTTNI